jgi:hypothetical protein
MTEEDDDDKTPLENSEITSVTPISDSEIRVTWRYVSGAKYTLFWVYDDKDAQTHRQDDIFDSTSEVIGNLYPNTRYWFSVQAFPTGSSKKTTSRESNQKSCYTNVITPVIWQAEKLSNTQVKLEIINANENYLGVSYELYRSSSNNLNAASYVGQINRINADTISILSNIVKTFTVPTGTKYYWIRVVGGNGSDAWSDAKLAQ